MQVEIAGLDYVNVPGSDTNKTPDKETSSSVVSAETTTTEGVDDSEELPDYVNVAVPQPEMSLPPPVPPRNK